VLTGHVSAAATGLILWRSFLAHGVFAVTTLTLVLLTALGLGTG
jgi:hypothetical protein